MVTIDRAISAIVSVTSGLRQLDVIHSFIHLSYIQQLIQMMYVVMLDGVQVHIKYMPGAET